MSDKNIQIRGANGLNLNINPLDPADNADLMDCENIDISVDRCIQPRLGLGRPDITGRTGASEWPGVANVSTGKLHSGSPITVPGSAIISMCSGIKGFIIPPGVEQ